MSWQEEQVLWRLDYIIRRVNRLVRMEAKEMAALDDLKREVAETKTVQESAITLLQGLKAALDEAIASGDPAALAALATDLDTMAAALSDAIVANTPAARTR